jgi:hypothetical protein
MFLYSLSFFLFTLLLDLPELYFLLNKRKGNHPPVNVNLIINYPPFRHHSSKISKLIILLTSYYTPEETLISNPA